MGPLDGGGGLSSWLPLAKGFLCDVVQGITYWWGALIWVPLICLYFSFCPVIGRGGEQINKIQQDSGCKVQISPGTPPPAEKLPGTPGQSWHCWVDTSCRCHSGNISAVFIYVLCVCWGHVPIMACTWRSEVSSLPLSSRIQILSLVIRFGDEHLCSLSHVPALVFPLCIWGGLGECGHGCGCATFQVAGSLVSP